MKVISFLCLLLSLSLSGQNLVLEPLQKNSLYAHGSNYFHIHIDTPCDSVLVIASNGNVEKDSCWLNIVPVEVERINLSFYNVSNNDTVLIESQEFRVVDIPLPYVTLYRKREGVFSKGALLLSKGLNSDYMDWQAGACGVSAKISSYRVLVLRGDSLVGTMNVEAAHFTDEVKSIFEKMERDDKVYFMDIWATSPLGDSMKLTDVSFGVE